MNDQEQVTLGEVYRLCLSIHAIVNEQDDRISALEKDAIRLKTIWIGIVVALGFVIDWLKKKWGLS
jgi:hypothetical protein